jgi:hypothetical protein
MEDWDISSELSNVDDAGTKELPRESSIMKRPSLIQQHSSRDDMEFLPPISNKPSVVEDNKDLVFRDKPIQLVKVDTNIGKFQLCEQGLKVLRGIEGNIGIIAFAGLYRTGKSFTLNLLLDKLGKGVYFNANVSLK